MVTKIQEQYYEMGFKLMSGIIVDEELAKQMQAIFDEAREKIKKLVLDNPQHCKETSSSYCYPMGKPTDFSYIAPKSWIDLNTERRLAMLNDALTMRKVQYLYESDKNDIDRIKAFVQRSIEDEQLAGEGGGK